MERLCSITGAANDELNPDVAPVSTIREMRQKTQGQQARLASGATQENLTEQRWIDEHGRQPYWLHSASERNLASSAARRAERVAD